MIGSATSFVDTPASAIAQRLTEEGRYREEAHPALEDAIHVIVDARHREFDTCLRRSSASRVMKRRRCDAENRAEQRDRRIVLRAHVLPILRGESHLRGIGLANQQIPLRDRFQKLIDLLVGRLRQRLGEARVQRGKPANQVPHTQRPAAIPHEHAAAVARRIRILHRGAHV